MKTLAFFCFGLLTCTTYGQVENPNKSETNQTELSGSDHLSNRARYGIDYELVNYNFVNGDSTVLDALNLDEYLTHKKPQEDLDISNLSTGITVRVYSIEKARIRREQSTPKEL